MERKTSTEEEKKYMKGEEKNGKKIRKGGKIFNYKTKLIWYDQRLSCMVTELHYAVI